MTCSTTQQLSQWNSSRNLKIEYTLQTSRIATLSSSSLIPRPVLLAFCCCKQCWEGVAWRRGRPLCSHAGTIVFCDALVIFHRAKTFCVSKYVVFSISVLCFWNNLKAVITSYITRCHDNTTSHKEERNNLLPRPAETNTSTIVIL